jgi:hypothetical protein
MTQFETLNGQPRIGYHDLRRRAEVARNVSRQLQSEFFGANTKRQAFSIRDFWCEVVKLVGQ